MTNFTNFIAIMGNLYSSTIIIFILIYYIIFYIDKREGNMKNIIKQIEDLETFKKLADEIERCIENKYPNTMNKVREMAFISDHAINNLYERVFYETEENKNFRKTIPAYIKRRLKDKNLIDDDNIVAEKYYDVSKILEIAKLMKVFLEYGFCKVDLNLNNRRYDIYNVNHTKLLKAKFKDEVFLYPNVDYQEPKNISDFNNNLLDKNISEDERISQILKIKCIHTDYLVINNIRYYRNDMQRYFATQELYDAIMNMKIDGEFNNCRTVLYKTKDCLDYLMDIKNGNKICDDEMVVNFTKDSISIETEEDKILHYIDSVNEIRKNLSQEKWILFSYILSWENGHQGRVNLGSLIFGYSEEDEADEIDKSGIISEKSNIKELFSIYEYFYDANSEEIYKEALLGLLIKGYLYMV